MLPRGYVLPCGSLPSQVYRHPCQGSGELSGGRENAPLEKTAPTLGVLQELRAAPTPCSKQPVGIPPGIVSLSVPALHNRTNLLPLPCCTLPSDSSFGENKHVEKQTAERSPEEVANFIKTNLMSWKLAERQDSAKLQLK